MAKKPTSPHQSQRYGTARPATQSKSTWSGKLMAIATVVFVIFAVITVAGFLQRKEAQLFNPQITGFSRTNNSTIRLKIDVERKKPNHPSVCIVYALDYTKAEIGRREFLIPPTTDKTYHTTIDVPTRGIPVIGKMYGCSEHIPAYLTHSPKKLP